MIEPINPPVNLLFVTAFHPGAIGFIGAGEAASAQHIELMCKAGFHIHVLCFTHGYQVENPEVVKLCKTYTTVLHTPLSSILGIMQSIKLGALFSPWFYTRVSKKNLNFLEEKIKILNISRVHLDFPSCLGFSAYIKKIKVGYTVHDLISQKVERRSLPVFIKNKIRATEAVLLTKINYCITPSKKDASICRQLGFVKTIDVIVPSIKVGEVRGGKSILEIVNQFQGHQNMVFFGNMHRAENHLSIIKFLTTIYPKIWINHRGVRLWVMGLSPRLSLRILGRILPGVRIVGAVDDPTLAFKEATLCIAPIWYGAGVKIKVLQMLDAGAKVVATKIGAEGIEDNQNLVIASDKLFAKSVNSILLD